MVGIRTYVRGTLDVARSYAHIAALLPAGGAGLVTLLTALNVVLGLLPVLFIVATSVMIGRVPAAVTAGVGSAEWTALVLAFVLAAAAFVATQILAPLQSGLGELLARRVDGIVFRRLIAASLRSTGIATRRESQYYRGIAIGAGASPYFAPPGRPIPLPPNQVPALPLTIATACSRAPIAAKRPPPCTNSAQARTLGAIEPAGQAPDFSPSSASSTDSRRIGRCCGVPQSR